MEFDATFSRAQALEVGVGGGPERALGAYERLCERGEVIDLVDGRQTTRAHRAMERRALAAAEQLASGRVEPVDADRVARELAVLRSELAPAVLADEQEQAVRAACSDRQLAVIVGQAGTGKSTALRGVARAHRADGREVIVTSTGAQAAERLTGELAEAGVQARGFSAVGLRAGVERGAVAFGPGVVVLHDEAALASTREQEWLLGAVAGSGARVVEVGDPRQSRAVGAAGLWPQVERLAGEQGAHVELSRIVRARGQADRRDQALWRAGEHDRALEAAQSDRQAGKTTLVVVQASNGHLDELHARAQALRVQDGELGERGVVLAARAYGLHAGDGGGAARRHPASGGRRGAQRRSRRGARRRL